jgi:hypothetical protein
LAIGRYEINYPVSPDDMVEAARFAGGASSRRTKVTSVAAVLLVGLAGAAFVDPAAGVFAVVIGLLFVVAEVPRAYMRWSARRIMRSVTDGISHVVIDRDGIHFEDPHLSGEISWSKLTEVRENNRTIVFMRDRVLAGYIPVSAFASPDQLAEIVAFARERIDLARGPDLAV